MILLPLWAPFNIYEMSAWSRTIIVPLSLLWACQPKTILSPEHQLDELYARPEKKLSRSFGGVNSRRVQPRVGSTGRGSFSVSTARSSSAKARREASQ